MKQTAVRKIHVADTTVNNSPVEYSVIIGDLFNADGNVVGEIYGACVSGVEDSVEIPDLTIHESRIFAFVKKLCANAVTPVSLFDITCDSLPL